MMMRLDIKLYILGLAFLVLCAACAPIRSDKWYDTQKDHDPYMRFFQKSIAPKEHPRYPTASIIDYQDKTTITARSNDTYYKIAERYSIDVRDLIEANHAIPPYDLQKGERLLLPHKKVHIVEKGDTIYSVSQLYGASIRSLVIQNHLRPPYRLHIEQKLNIPASRKRKTTKLLARDVGLPETQQQYRQHNKQHKKIAIPLAPKLAGEFFPPVRGVLISGFGAKADGLHNDGIDIAASFGDDVLATENGVVVYAGEDLHSYGRLLLIKHRNDYVSAYAHLSSFLVERGQIVKRGDVIGKIGNPRHTKTPQLHFEIRQGEKAIDPETLI